MSRIHGVARFDIEVPESFYSWFISLKKSKKSKKLEILTFFVIK